MFKRLLALRSGTRTALGKIDDTNRPSQTDGTPARGVPATRGRRTGHVAAGAPRAGGVLGSAVRGSALARPRAPRAGCVPLSVGGDGALLQRARRRRHGGGAPRRHRARDKRSPPYG